MTKITLFFFWFLLTSAITYAQDFELISASSRPWVAGVKDAGRGTNYKFTLKALKSSKQLKISGLWIGEKYFKINYYVFHHPVFPIKESNSSFKQMDTLCIDFDIQVPGELISDDKNQSAQIGPAIYEIKKPPYAYKGKALIAYSYKKKKKYLEIEKLEILESIQEP